MFSSLLSRRVATSVVGTLFALNGLTAQAAAASVVVAPRAPYGSCGSHFQLTRTSQSIRVVGTSLNVYSSGYMLVYPSDSHSKSYGAYNASPYGGANFVIDTGVSSKQFIYITLTNSSNTVTLCADSYYV